MKTYNNGPRKGMMYGGAAKRKPMMYGGMATKKRKKMQYGGTANEMSAKKATGQQMPRKTASQRTLNLRWVCLRWQVAAKQCWATLIRMARCQTTRRPVKTLSTKT